MDNFPKQSDCDPLTGTVVHYQTVKKVYYFFVNFIMFLLPILIMLVCYSMIICKLYSTSSPGERIPAITPQARAKRKVVKLVVVVIFAFVICWSPHQIPMAHAIFFTGSQVSYACITNVWIQYQPALISQLPIWVTENQFWINMFAYSHAMINPIIYIVFNDNFKKSFKQLICCTNEEIIYEYSNREFLFLYGKQECSYHLNIFILY